MNSFGIGINQYFSYYFVLESEKINSNLSWHSQKNDISASSINSVQFLFSLSTTTLEGVECSWITVFWPSKCICAIHQDFDSVQFTTVHIFLEEITWLLSYLPRGPLESASFTQTIFLGVFGCNAISKRVLFANLHFLTWKRLSIDFKKIICWTVSICLIFVVCLARKRICIF